MQINAKLYDFAATFGFRRPGFVARSGVGRLFAWATDRQTGETKPIATTRKGAWTAELRGATTPVASIAAASIVATGDTPTPDHSGYAPHRREGKREEAI
jgi:hypothetical protein